MRGSAAHIFKPDRDRSTADEFRPRSNSAIVKTASAKAGHQGKGCMSLSRLITSLLDQALVSLILRMLLDQDRIRGIGNCTALRPNSSFASQHSFAKAPTPATARLESSIRVMTFKRSRELHHRPVHIGRNRSSQGSVTLVTEPWRALILLLFSVARCVCSIVSIA